MGKGLQLDGKSLGPERMKILKVKYTCYGLIEK